MRTGLKDLYRRLFEPKALVLMYHRVAEPDYDTWDISVSPANFEQQLQVLRQLGNVVPLQELVQDIRSNRLTKDCIAITFDDGYADNYNTAKPLLEQYKLPATFFIASGNIGQSTEFWWDELEYFILFTPHLPAQLEITIAGKHITYSLQQEAQLSEELKQRHRHWKATVEPPFSLRAKLYYLLWEHLKPLPHTEQQEVLRSLRQWAGIAANPRTDYLSMTEAQLQELGQNQYITIGAHTVTHPALAMHDAAYQQQEFLESKLYLEQQIGLEVSLFAYPYGNYNQHTLAVAQKTHFNAAFTTAERIVTKRSGVYQLARFQVKDLPAAQFRKQLKQWKNHDK